MRLLTCTQVAEKLSLTRRTVYRLQGQGLIPASFRISKSSARWDEAEIDEFLEGRKERGRFRPQTAS